MDRIINDQDNKQKAAGFPEAELRSDIENIPIRVLIAEDEDPIRILLQKALSMEGYQIVTAANGTEAWKALQDKDNPPRLAVLDWMMPGMSGLDLCRRLKNREHPFVYTILLTAKTQDNDVIQGLQAGAHEFLNKPFNIEVLRSRVATGARIVRLETLLSMKNEILEYYVAKVESLVETQNPDS